MGKDKSGIEPGTILDGKYRIEGIVGAGGMGAVYEATHVVIGRKVAIKTLHAAFVRDEHVLMRFRREAELAGSIGHDNICEVTDFGITEDGSPFLVMPLLKGSSFSDVLAAQKTLAPPRLVDIVSQTLSALEAAHGAQIVHRDLKPENIFITRIGDRNDFVKLLDFGISKVLDQDTVLNLTRTGTVLGTPYYMSPEQAKGAKDVDHRSDIYATGVMVYEALTGKRPFEGDSYNEVMFKIIAEPLPSPRELNPAISAALDGVVTKAMNRDPDERYADAGKMRDALDGAISGRLPGASMQHAATEVQDSVGDGGSSQLSETKTPLATELRTVEIPAAGSRSKSKMLIGILGLAAVLLAAFGFYVFKMGPKEEPFPVPVPITAPTEPPGIMENVEDAGVEEASLAEEETAEPKLEIPVASDAEEQAVAEEKKKRRSRRRKSKRAKSTEVVITPPSPTKVSLPTEQQPQKPKDKKEVEGRFGTKIVSDYDD